MSNVLQTSDLAEFFLTKEGLDSLVLSLKLVKQIVLKKDEKFPPDAQFASFPFDHVEMIKELWSRATSRQADVSWISFLTQVEALLFESLAHMVTLRIAYEPTLEQLGELTMKVRQHYSPSAVLDIVYEPGLIAGCIMEVNGNRADYSLQYLLGNLHET